MSDEADDTMPMGFAEAPAQFIGPTQKARIWTETWARTALFCPACGADRFEPFAANAPVADFYCPSCDEEFELKRSKSRFGARVVDGAFKTMSERVAARNNPNLILLNYDLASFGVTDVRVVPRHFFTQDIIQQRKPLAPTARRAGWVGCNILLGRVPDAGKITIVRDRQPVPKAQVLDQWRATLFLRDQGAAARGWLMDVMRAVEIIGQAEFTLDDVYAHEARLQALYPGNNKVRPKIRQQLQVLRDKGFLVFEGRGRYRLAHPRRSDPVTQTPHPPLQGD